jgi:hypothetical protein
MQSGGHPSGSVIEPPDRTTTATTITRRKKKNTAMLLVTSPIEFITILFPTFP